MIFFIVALFNTTSPLFPTCIASLLPCSCCPLYPYLHSIVMKLMLVVSHHLHPGPVKTWLSTNAHSSNTDLISLALFLSFIHHPLSLLYSFMSLCPHLEIAKCCVSNFQHRTYQDLHANSTKRGEEVQRKKGTLCHKQMQCNTEKASNASINSGSKITLRQCKYVCIFD